MATLRKILFFTITIAVCLSCNATERKQKDSGKSNNYGGFTWAKPYDYNKEDSEIGVGGRQFKRILEASSFDIKSSIEIVGTELRAKKDKILFNETAKVASVVERGTERDPKTCTETDQDGGAAAVLNSACNVTLWMKYRQNFLKEIMKTTFEVELLKRHPTDVEPHFNKYLFEQIQYFDELTEKERTKTDEKTETGLFEFFADLCISCTGEPLLMCTKNPSGGGKGACKCWDYYLTEKVNGVEECRIAVGKRCHHVVGAKCVVNAFCDQKYTCRCMTRRKCLKGGGGQLGQGQPYIMIVTGIVLLGLKWFNG